MLTPKVRNVGTLLVWMVALSQNILIRSILNVSIQCHEVTSFISSTSFSVPTSIRLINQQFPISMSKKESNEIDDIQKMKKEAQKIRNEINAFEQKKKDIVEKELMEVEKMKQEKQTIRDRYAVNVPILKGNGETVMEKVDFPPRFSGGKSKVFAYQAKLPLGLILGEHERIPGAISVDETLADGNGSLSGVKEGDLLRAVTACQVTMETPTWQLIAGGIGQPKTKRFMFGTDNVPFEEVMEAVSSNRMDPEGRDVWLVVERNAS